MKNAHHFFYNCGILALLLLISGCSHSEENVAKVNYPLGLNFESVSPEIPQQRILSVERGREYLAQSPTNRSNSPDESSELIYVADSPYVASPRKETPMVSHFNTPKEMVLYYGPTLQKNSLQPSSREILKVGGSSFDVSSVEPEPFEASERLQAMAEPLYRADPEVASLKPFRTKCALSGEAREIEGMFQPLGFKRPDFVGRRKAVEAFGGDDAVLRGQGEIIYIDAAGWGYFVPLEIGK